MRKIICIVLIILSLIIIPVSDAKTTKLEKIAKNFNNHESVKNFRIYGNSWKATVKKNKLKIKVKKMNNSLTLTYTLKGNVLSGSFKNEKTSTAINVTQYLIDVISIMNGYDKGEVFDTINYEYLDYTIKNEGLEISTNKTDFYNIKININKKIPLYDFNNINFNKEELANLKNEDSFQIKKGYLWLYKKENIVIIGERKGFTEKSLNTIYNVIDVIFESDEINKYITENINKIEDTTIDGFEIKTNMSIKELIDSSIPIPHENDYNFIKITIDKDKVISSSTNDIKSFTIGIFIGFLIITIICTFILLYKPKTHA